MERLEFDCMFDLAETMIALLGESDDDYPIVSAYGKYDVIKSLLEDLIMSGVEIANEIELQEYDIAHYNKEFILYLTKNGVNVEKTYRDGEYLYGGGEISFVHEDCNSKLLPYVDSKTIYEFGMIDDDECDCDECCECACQNNNELSTTSAYYVNGRPVDKSVYEGYAETFDKRMKEFEAEMNAFRHLFGF